MNIINTYPKKLDKKYGGCILGNVSHFWRVGTPHKAHLKPDVYCRYTGIAFRIAIASSPL